MKKTKVLILALTAIVIYTAIFFIPQKNTRQKETKFEIVPASTTNERVNYFALHGWEVEEIAGKDIIIPSDFSEDYEEYAVLQDRQNLPLRRYSGKNARLYVYKVRNFRPENKNMLAELLVCDNTVIASMVYSEDGGRIKLSVS